VRIVYLDDSRQDRGPDRFQVIGAVVINDAIFDELEQHLGYYLYELIQPEASAKVEEFHASDILAGRPPFDNIKRERAIRNIVNRDSRCEWL
jgi:hypothetical protein